MFRKIYLLSMEDMDEVGQVKQYMQLRGNGLKLIQSIHPIINLLHCMEQIHLEDLMLYIVTMSL